MTTVNTESKHKLTKRQKLQLAEVQAAAKNSGTSTTSDPNAGGSDSDSGPAKNAAPIPAGTVPGSGTASPPVSATPKVTN